MKQILIISVSVFFIYGCSKPKPDNSNTSVTPACRIVTIIDLQNDDTLHITYNNSGKISKVSSGESVSNFEYSGNTITKTRFESGVLKERKIITTNAAAWLPI
ncbi:MAG: hypothetical protein ACM3H8_14660 [Sphingobacteriales bacterium]